VVIGTLKKCIYKRNGDIVVRQTAANLP